MPLRLRCQPGKMPAGYAFGNIFDLRKEQLPHLARFAKSSRAYCRLATHVHIQYTIVYSYDVLLLACSAVHIY